MKRLWIFLLFTISRTVFSQSHNIEISNVEGFMLDSTSHYLKLYSKRNGVITDSILIPNEKEDFNRVLIIIDKISNDWTKIKFIRYAPGANPDSLITYKGKWINKTALYFNVGIVEEGRTKVFENSNKSKTIDFIDGSQTVKIVAVKKSWAKVIYKKDRAEKTGWIAREDQCAYFWTACNWNNE